MITIRCPRCGHQAIQTRTGILLDPQPNPTGLWLADGQRVTARDIIHRKPQHAAHDCQPPDQLDLFGGAA